MCDRRYVRIKSILSLLSNYKRNLGYDLEDNTTTIHLLCRHCFKEKWVVKQPEQVIQESKHNHFALLESSEQYILGNEFDYNI